MQDAEIAPPGASIAELPVLRPAVEAYLSAGGQERADAARHRHAILDAARKLMRGRAVLTVTMKDVANRAGVGQGTLYRKFPTKAYLAGALLSEALLGVEDALLEERNREPEPRTLLRWFVQRMAAFTAEHADLIAIGMSKENMPTGWLEQTGPVVWLVHVMATLFVASGAAADAEEGVDRARMLLPLFLLPGDVSTADQRAAYEARAGRLLERLLRA